MDFNAPFIFDFFSGCPSPFVVVANSSSSASLALSELWRSDMRATGGGLGGIEGGGEEKVVTAGQA
jgi:hypothetical protein